MANGVFKNEISAPINTLSSVEINSTEIKRRKHKKSIKSLANSINQARVVDNQVSQSSEVNIAVPTEHSKECTVFYYLQLYHFSSTNAFF